MNPTQIPMLIVISNLTCGNPTGIPHISIKVNYFIQDRVELIAISWMGDRI